MTDDNRPVTRRELAEALRAEASEWYDSSEAVACPLNARALDSLADRLSASPPVEVAGGWQSRCVVMHLSMAIDGLEGNPWFVRFADKVWLQPGGEWKTSEPWTGIGFPTESAARAALAAAPPPPGVVAGGEMAEHICGAQGFGRGTGSADDFCPACRGMTKKQYGEELVRRRSPGVVDPPPATAAQNPAEQDRDDKREGLNSTEGVRALRDALVKSRDDKKPEAFDAKAWAIDRITSKMEVFYNTRNKAVESINDLAAAALQAAHDAGRAGSASNAGARPRRWPTDGPEHTGVYLTCNMNGYWNPAHYSKASGVWTVDGHATLGWLPMWYLPMPPAPTSEGTVQP